MSSLINQVASGFLQNSENEHLEKIDVSLIQPSSFNIMPIVNIDDLAKQIEQDGLQNPLHVRQVDNGYVCIGGHRRLEAIKQLEWNHVQCIVRHDIQTDTDEQIAVAVNNNQREETKEILQLRIKEWEKIFLVQKEAGNVEDGLRKIDWIAQFTNCSRSTVQRYLTTYKNISDNNITYQAKEFTVDNLAKILIKARKNILVKKDDHQILFSESEVGKKIEETLKYIEFLEGE